MTDRSGLRCGYSNAEDDPFNEIPVYFRLHNNVIRERFQIKKMQTDRNYVNKITFSIQTNMLQQDRRCENHTILQRSRLHVRVSRISSRKKTGVVRKLASSMNSRFCGPLTDSQKISASFPRLRIRTFVLTTPYPYNEC